MDRSYRPRHGDAAPRGSLLETLGLIAAVIVVLLVFVVQSLSPIAYVITCGWSDQDCDRSNEGVALLIFFGAPALTLILSLMLAFRGWVLGRHYWYWPLLALLATEACYLIAALVLNA